MHLVPILTGIVVSYLLGAIPCGLLIARARGVDIRTVGSGNIGATNVLRAVGKGPGILALLLDALKGFIPAFALPLCLRMLETPPPPFPVGLLFGVAAIVGHNWPLYLRFKGGKGVATSAGVLVGIAPAAAGIGLVAWLLLFATTRYVSVASMGAAVAVACAGWLLYHEGHWSIPTALSLLAILIVWRHRANIQRLRSGNENRFERTKAKESS